MISLLNRWLYNRKASKVKAWQKVLSVLCGAATLFTASGQQAAATAVAAQPVINWVRVGGSVSGELYADRDSLQPYTKNGSLYLGLMVQEKYTNAEFLRIMHKNPGLEKLASSLTLYMFQVKGESYFVASQFYLDDEDKVCLDLGADKVVRPVNSDPIVKLLFEYSLREARRDSVRVQGEAAQ